jgi:hypothetical protein
LISIARDVGSNLAYCSSVSHVPDDDYHSSRKTLSLDIIHPMLMAKSVKTGLTTAQPNTAPRNRVLLLRLARLSRDYYTY